MAVATIEHEAQEAQLPAVQGQSTSLRPMRPDEWQMIGEQAKVLAAAGKGTSLLPKGIENQYQIAAILMKGHELGLQPMYALEQIALVNGRPVVQGQALLAIITNRYGPKAIVRLELDEKHARYQGNRPGRPSIIVEWSIERAKKAGLTEKQVWKQYPETMLKWRVIAEIAHEMFPDTVAGLRTPDEMGVPLVVTDEGDIEVDRDAPAQTVQIAEVPAQEPQQPARSVEHPEPRNPENAGKAEFDTLEAVFSELANVRGQSEPWRKVFLEFARLGGITVSKNKPLTKAEARTLLETAQTQIGLLRSNQEDGVIESDDDASMVITSLEV